MIARMETTRETIEEIYVCMRIYLFQGSGASQPGKDKISNEILVKFLRAV